MHIRTLEGDLDRRLSCNYLQQARTSPKYQTSLSQSLKHPSITDRVESLSSLGFLEKIHRVGQFSNGTAYFRLGFFVIGLFDKKITSCRKWEVFYVFSIIRFPEKLHDKNCTIKTVCCMHQACRNEFDLRALKVAWWWGIMGQEAYRCRGVWGILPGNCRKFGQALMPLGAFRSALWVTAYTDSHQLCIDATISKLSKCYGSKCFGFHVLFLLFRLGSFLSLPSFFPSVFQ